MKIDSRSTLASVSFYFIFISFFAFFLSYTNALLSGNHWLEVAKRRIWFERYAENKGFEPLIPENWYNITLEKINDPEVHIYHEIQSIQKETAC